MPPSRACGEGEKEPTINCQWKSESLQLLDGYQHILIKFTRSNIRHTYMKGTFFTTHAHALSVRRHILVGTYWYRVGTLEWWGEQGFKDPCTITVVHAE